MASDQPTSAANTPDSTAQQLPMLVVDPVVLGEAAQRLKELPELPEPHSPRATAPTAEAIGDRTLADAIEAFHRQYREVAAALAEDNKTTATHLADAADAYRRVESRITAILTDAAGYPPDTPDGDTPDNARPDSTRPDSTRPDSTRPDGAEPDGTRRDDSWRYAGWGDSASPDDTTPDDGEPGSSRPDGSWPADRGLDSTGQDGRSAQDVARRIREALEV